jgi:hypothetical protein
LTVTVEVEAHCDRIAQAVEAPHRLPGSRARPAHVTGCIEIERRTAPFD